MSFYIELRQRPKKISVARYLKDCLHNAFRSHGEGFFDIDPASDDLSLSEAFVKLTEKTSRSIVLIIDDVDELSDSRFAGNCLCALKAARAAVNLRYPNAEETYLMILGVGSCRAKVRRLTAGPSQAFFGSINEDFPLLGGDYLRWLIERSADVKYPSSATLSEGFEFLGFQPELLRTVLQEQRSSHEPLNEEDFLNFCRKKAAVAVSDVVSALGKADWFIRELFSWIAQAGDDGCSLQSLKTYAQRHEEFVGQPQHRVVAGVVSSLSKMQRCGWIYCCAFLTYAVSDPMVRCAWLQRQKRR